MISASFKTALISLCLWYLLAPHSSHSPLLLPPIPFFFFSSMSVHSTAVMRTKMFNDRQNCFVCCRYFRGQRGIGAELPAEFWGSITSFDFFFKPPSSLVSNNIFPELAGAASIEHNRSVCKPSESARDKSNFWVLMATTWSHWSVSPLAVRLPRCYSRHFIFIFPQHTHTLALLGPFTPEFHVSE